MSMSRRNGVIITAVAVVTMIQYHLLVNTDHINERPSRREPIDVMFSHRYLFLFASRIIPV